jgi:hypothetical protein
MNHEGLLPSLVPYIPTDKRAIPNDLIRSSLFTVSNHNTRREYIKERNLYTFGATKITYTGEELRQDDEDVWLQIIYYFSRVEENYVDFMPYTVLRELDWPARTQYCEKLKSSIIRMSATNICISNEEINAGLTLSLVRKFMWKQEDGKKLKRWRVWLEPEIVKLFADMRYSKIIWDQRKKLNPLAKWLHAYYSSHAEPYPVKIITLRDACGSKMKSIKHFKVTLRRALLELAAVGFLKDFWIDARNLVYVQRDKQVMMVGLLGE